MKPVLFIAYLFTFSFCNAQADSVQNNKNHEIFIEALGPGTHGTLGYNFIIHKNKFQFKPTIGLGGIYSHNDFYQAFMPYSGLSIHYSISNRFSVFSFYYLSLYLNRAFIFPNKTSNCLNTGYPCNESYDYRSNFGIGTSLTLSKKLDLSLSIYTVKRFVKTIVFVMPSLKLSYKL
jgi:hypothetical protein